MDRKVILMDLLRRTPLRIFNLALSNYNLQKIYAKQQNYLVYKYFDGQVLKYAVVMRKIFDEFQTSADEQSAKFINEKLYWLSKDIRLKKKYKQYDEYNKLAKEYNSLVNKLDDLNKGVCKLRILFKSIYRKQIHDNPELTNA